MLEQATAPIWDDDELCALLENFGMVLHALLDETARKPVPQKMLDLVDVLREREASAQLKGARRPDAGARPETKNAS